MRKVVMWEMGTNMSKQKRTTGRKQRLYIKKKSRSSYRVSAEKDLTSIPEDTSSIPGLAQWVKDLALS